MMNQTILTSGFFSKKRRNLIAKLPGNSVAVIFSNPEYLRNGDQFFPYRQNSNQFYLSGINQQGTILVVCPGHPEPKFREVLFIVKKDEAQVAWTGPGLSIGEAQMISGIKNILYTDNFRQVFRGLALTAEKIFLTLNENPKLPADYLFNEDQFAERLRKDFPGHAIGRLGPLLDSLRMVKEPEEIELIRKATEITLSAFEKTLEIIKPGIPEKEIEGILTYEFTRQGYVHAYRPIAGSGISACTLHYADNNKICKDGDLLLMDFGAEAINYAADCTRTVPVNGRFTKRQKELYEGVLRVQKETIKMYVPGNTLENLNRQAGELMQEELLKNGLLTIDEVKANPKAYRKYFIHGLAHSLGLDVHDPFDKYRPFEKGMVLTCEPGVYIREEGTGIRIENDIVVDDPPIDLMENFPREVDEIEERMNKK